MKAKIMFTAVIVFLAVVVLASGSNISADDKGSAMDWRQKCLISCNEAYGGVEWMRPPQDQYHGWATCVLRCERGFSDKLDKETEDGK